MKYNLEVLNRLCDIMKEIRKQGDVMSLDYVDFTALPKGDKQESDSELWDHEYIKQSTGYSCDDYYGDWYVPIGDGKHYFHFYYTA